MHDVVFLKLGGSLITDKTGVEAVRSDTLLQAATEIRQALAENPGLRLVLGHGSGSFGHVAAAKYGTRHGVETADQWAGFVKVSHVAAKLNRLVTEALQSVGVPAISFQSSASAVCENGRITALNTTTIQMALQAGLVPVVYGDVAFDTAQGGTIISTEEIMTYLVAEIRPFWLLLAGETAGVYGLDGQIIPQITPANFGQIQPALGGSRGTDVTGGMASKVQSMLKLTEHYPGLRIRIFSGLETGELKNAILQPQAGVGTTIQSET